MKSQHIMISNINTNTTSVASHTMAEVVEPDYTMEGEIDHPGEYKEKEIKHLDIAQCDASLKLLKILSKSEHCTYVFKDGDPLFLESHTLQHYVNCQNVNGFIETIKLFLENHEGSVIQYMKCKIRHRLENISLLDLLCIMIKKNNIENKYLIDIFSREKSINISEYFIVKSYDTNDYFIRYLKYLNEINAKVLVALIMIDGSKKRFFRRHIFNMTKRKMYNTIEQIIEHKKTNLEKYFNINSINTLVQDNKDKLVTKIMENY